MQYNYPERYQSLLPEEIFFVTTQELEDTWPELLPADREKELPEKKSRFYFADRTRLKQRISA